MVDWYLKVINSESYIKSKRFKILHKFLVRACSVLCIAVFVGEIFRSVERYDWEDQEFFVWEIDIVNVTVYR